MSRRLLNGDFVLFERWRYTDTVGTDWTPGRHDATYPTDGVRSIVLHPDGTYTVEWLP